MLEQGRRNRHDVMVMSEACQWFLGGCTCWMTVACVTCIASHS